MKIAVIGAGIAGLSAGRELAKAGHEVIVYEKNESVGGRLATEVIDQGTEHILDYGAPYIQAESSAFQQFIVELMDKNLITIWDGVVAKRDRNGQISRLNDQSPYYIAPEGMKQVAKHLSRMLDVRTGEKVGGLTHIGENRRVKRTWMLNMITRNTESTDAVIIATSARPAYALLNTTIDEIDTLKIVREIDEVSYAPQFTYVAGYRSAEKPAWNVLHCEDDVIAGISNEGNKHEEEGETTLVIQSTPSFARNHLNGDREEIIDKLNDKLGEILGGWAGLPDWTQLHFWKYSQAENPLPHDYMELTNEETPLALVGGYMNGNTVESAYLSGLKLGKYWAKLFEDK